MIHDKAAQHQHLANIAAIGFFATVIFFICSLIFAPFPDFTKEIPVISDVMLTFGQISTSFFILGCVTYGVKMVEEKNPLAAVGFTMLSIAQGVIFVLYLLSYSGHEKFEEAYRMFSASLYMLTISYLIIALYAPFKLWLRILGIASCIPYITENIMYHLEHKFTETTMQIDGVGNMLFMLVTFCWGIVILKLEKNPKHSS